MFKYGRRLKFYAIIPIIIFIVTLIYLSQWDQSIQIPEENNIDDWKWYNYTKDNLNGAQVSMDDPKVINKLKQFLIKPVDRNINYRLTNPEVKDPSMGQANKIKKILKNRRNGFFIEVGALDGEIRSNTLYFERFLNWTGLLIEPDPLNFKELIRKNRKAWLSPTCLSINSYPDIVLFEQNKNMGKIADKETKVTGSTVNVQCFPLYTYLLALNITNIDYFSLDVEGAELSVLKTIPFKEINIETLSVEFVHVPGGKDAVSQFMFSQGYVVDSEVVHPNWLANDFIFVKM